MILKNVSKMRKKKKKETLRENKEADIMTKESGNCGINQRNNISIRRTTSPKGRKEKYKTD